MDSRDRAAYFGGSPKKIIIEVEREDGWMEEVDLPTKYEVCPVCQGKGHHVNPSIDAHGLTAEDFAEDPDFAEEYFSGTYDVICYECHGNNVVPTVDRDACPKDLLDKYDAWQEDKWAYESEVAHQLKYGY